MSSRTLDGQLPLMSHRQGTSRLNCHAVDAESDLPSLRTEFLKLTCHYGTTQPRIVSDDRGSLSL